MAPQPKPGVQERILLHLLDYSDFKSSVEVPFALSQMGIANAVAIAPSIALPPLSIIPAPTDAASIS